jgi:hypothetical protein
MREGLFGLCEGGRASLSRPRLSWRPIDYFPCFTDFKGVHHPRLYNDVILDGSGKAVNAILAVGGFLGMGEQYLAVAFDKLKWVNEPVRSTTASTSTPPAKGPAQNAFDRSHE